MTRPRGYKRSPETIEKIKTALRSRCVPVVATEVSSGKQSSYTSILAAAKGTSHNPGSVWYSCRTGTVTKKGYRFSTPETLRYDV